MESNSSQWTALLNSLKELITWCRNQTNQIDSRKQSVQTDTSLLQKQINEFKVNLNEYNSLSNFNEFFLKVFMCNVEYKKSIIESTINSAKLYNNENDKKSAYDVDDNIDLLELNDLNIDEEINDDFLSIIQMNETEQSKFIINKIETKVKILKYFWKKLNKRTQDYNFYLINLYQSLQQLNKICDSVNQKFNEYEQLISKLEEYSENSKEKLINENEKLAENLNYIKNLQSGLNKCQSQIEDMNLKYRNLKDELIQISPPVISIDDRCNDLNKRWLALNSLLQEKYDNLYNLIEISGADIFL